MQSVYPNEIARFYDVKPEIKKYHVSHFYFFIVSWETARFKRKTNNYWGNLKFKAHRLFK